MPAFFFRFRWEDRSRLPYVVQLMCGYGIGSAKCVMIEPFVCECDAMSVVVGEVVNLIQGRARRSGVGDFRVFAEYTFSRAWVMRRLVRRMGA